LKNTDQLKILLFGKDKACYPAENFFQLERMYKPDSGLLNPENSLGAFWLGGGIRKKR
jgi:hypothetical protein